MSSESELDDFLGLSRILTGEPRLARELAAQYLSRLTASAASTVTTMLATYRELAGILSCVALEQAVSQKIAADPSLGPVARNAIYLWFTGAIPDAQGINWQFGAPEQYLNGLIWRVIGAHPPAYSNGYYGHWRYPPDR